MAVASCSGWGASGECAGPFAEAVDQGLAADRHHPGAHTLVERGQRVGDHLGFGDLALGEEAA